LAQESCAWAGMRRGVRRLETSHFRAYNLREIPDRWKQYDPENPPYRYFPNRSKEQTKWGSLFGTAVLFGVGWYIAERQERASEKKVQQWSDDMPIVITQADKRHSDWQNDAFREIFLDARRRRMGLPTRILGSGEIQDGSTLKHGDREPSRYPLPPNLRS